MREHYNVSIDNLQHYNCTVIIIRHYLRGLCNVSFHNFEQCNYTVIIIRHYIRGLYNVCININASILLNASIISWRYVRIRTLDKRADFKFLQKGLGSLISPLTKDQILGFSTISGLGMYPFQQKNISKFKTAIYSRRTNGD